jgi:rRNA maturation protein Nop10
MQAPPDDVKLSREEGEALIERLRANVLTSEDRGLLVKLIRLYFWLAFALRETKIGLGRLKRALFGEGRRPPPPTGGGEAMAGADATAAGGATPATGSATPTEGPADAPAAAPSERRRGHGRRGADAYPGAERVVCRHETLAAGQRCPACGRGTLYPLPAGAEIRIDGHALLSAVRHELERLRCSACGEVFTAPAPAGAEKYSPRARAVIALGRYYLGLPFYRIERYQALVGVPVADATQWELAERVADCAYPVFESLWELAAQGEVIFQDDTHVRILALLAENRHADATGATLERRGMHTTGLVVQVEKRVICLYRSGRAHAGDNLTALLARREAGRDKPIVMSDALAANQRDDDDTLIRCHCLAHGRRQFTDLDEVFPAEAHHVIAVLRACQSFCVNAFIGL